MRTRVVRSVSLVAILSLTPFALPAQEPAPPTDPVIGALAGRVGQFFEAVAADSAQNAFQELLSGSPLAGQKEAVKALVSKTGELATKYGRYRAFERIGMRRVGTDVVLLKYLYKCENLPVVWHFVFYRMPAAAGLPPEDDTWRVVSVRFDTELEALWY